MYNQDNDTSQPSLPQNDSAAEQEQRKFQLSLARTAYNYMFSYVEPVPLSADLPKGEAFTPDYEVKVLETFLPMAENFKNVVVGLLEREIADDIGEQALENVEKSYEKLVKEISPTHLFKDIELMKDFFKSVADLPNAMKNWVNIPKDIEKMATGLEKVFGEFAENGPTAFLKSTMYDMLSTEHGRDYLQAKSIEDYEKLFDTISTPLMLSIEQQSWMPKQGKPCEQDWFFGYLQIAGFNTTNLRGVFLEKPEDSQVVVLAELLEKFPITDEMFQTEIGDNSLTLHEAARLHRLYVCDYSFLDGAKTNEVHGEQRYLGAPIALFYWNSTPPEGYPPGGGVLQPVGIQLVQKYDVEKAPIFTPKDSGNANDANGLKWKIAKYFVNVSCAIQHEAIAHLGDCHLTVEPMVVAANRQLAEQHPILKLLKPHFRFTININDDAIHSLIIPGGVVATNVGPAIESTLDAISVSREQWRWDDNNPENVFRVRGVDKIPDFPFRDDTQLLWEAIHKYVGEYLKIYYHNDQDVREDNELQAWMNEMVLPRYAGFKGMNGLKQTGDENQPVELDTLEYLIQIVSQIIYIAGPQHASVNYAQYPLMSYMPSVAGTIYHEPPGKTTELQTEDDCIPWYPPLDVSIYTFSFEYLLSGVQYDTFGHYSSDPRTPYFKDEKAQRAVKQLQNRLALIEIEIEKRNDTRPMQYPFQLPSEIPNSISI